VKLHTVLLTAAAAIALAACNPAETPAPVTPPPADIAAPTAPSGPAAENTSDSLSSTPPADAAATPAAPGAMPASPAATTPAAPPAAPAAAGPTKAELDSGAAVYARTCAMCHGPTGAGTAMGVALTAGHEYAAIKEKIVKGIVNPGDKMPPLGAAMSADDLDDVSKFVESGF
jgi:mono/diheme cytochrome c family protein